MMLRIWLLMVVNFTLTFVALGVGGWPLALVTFLFGIGGILFWRINTPPTWPCGRGGWRFRQRLFAKRNGYFWLPCPVCGRKFGGHEWERANSIIDNPKTPHRGRGVCSAECRDLFVVRGGHGL